MSARDVTPPGGAEKRRRAKMAALALVVVSLMGCTPGAHTIRPYSEDGPEARNLEAEATNLCREHRKDAAPEARFTTDGCTLWPDRAWIECCIKHDMEYWCGGSADDRKRSDKTLRKCVTEKGYPGTGRLMYMGTRVGGHPWLPFAWRWGYGWEWPRGYEDLDRGDSTGEKNNRGK